MNVFNSDAIQGAFPVTVTKNLSASAHSMAITNMSHWDLVIAFDGRDGGQILPAYFSKTYAVTPSQQVTFTLQAAPFPVSNPSTNEYIDYNESFIEIETGLQPLSLPVYAQNVLGLKLKQDPASGFVAATQVSNLKTFTYKLSYLQVWNIDNQGRIGLLNFNKATGSGDNSDFQLFPDPNKQHHGDYVAFSAAYNGIYYQGADLQMMGWYDPNGQ